MLEKTSDLTLPPSSNLRVDEDTSWLHALPSLEWRKVLWVGPIPPEHETALRERSTSLEVVTAKSEPFPRDDLDSRDLIILSQPASLTGWPGSLAHWLEGDPTIAVRPGTWLERLRVGTLLRRRWPSPGGWYLLRYHSNRPRVVRRAKKALRLLSGRLRRWTPSDGWRSHDSDQVPVRPQPVENGLVGRGVLLHGIGEPGPPPRYIRSIAERHGLDVAGGAWWLGPARGFRSQKVVVVIEPDPESSGIVVKTTQSARFNARLRAEASALEVLAGIDLRMSLARPLFTECHAGLLVHGQTRLGGVAFRRAADPVADSPLLQEAVAAVTDLALKTRSPTGPAEVEAALMALIETHSRIWAPPRSVTDDLRRAAKRVADGLRVTAFSHGDLGIWNVMVREDGSIAALDWENADPRGMPLWDLFELVRTFGVFLADGSGMRYDAGVFSRQLIDDSPLRRVLAEAVRAYCGPLDIPAEIADDVFALCWVQNANREAASTERPAWPLGRNNGYLIQCLTGGVLSR